MKPKHSHLDADQHDAARRQSASWLTDQDIEEFKDAYEEAYGERLSSVEARDMATRVMELYKLLARLLPDEKIDHDFE